MQVWQRQAPPTNWLVSVHRPLGLGRVDFEHLRRFRFALRLDRLGRDHCHWRLVQVVAKAVVVELEDVLGTLTCTARDSERSVSPTTRYNDGQAGSRAATSGQASAADTGGSTMEGWGIDAARGKSIQLPSFSEAYL